MSIMDKREIKSDGLAFKLLEEMLYISYVVIGYYLSFMLRYRMNPDIFNLQPFYDSIPYIIVASFIIFYIYDILSTFKRSLFENAVTVFIPLMLINITTAAIAFFIRGFAFPRSIFLIGLVVQFLLIFTTKHLIFKYFISKRMGKDILIVVSSMEEAEYIAKKILLDKNNFDNIKYICHDISGKTYELIDAVDKAYIGDTIANDDKLNIINYCSEKGKDIYLIPSLYEISLVDFKVSQVDDLLVFKLEDLGLTYEQRFIKRTMDIFISSIGLIITSPVLLIVSLIIKLYDKGSVFYKQERVTENNKLFNLYKFRTMVEDAEKHTGPVLATDKDTRITPVGRFLRASRIDELPQLINVLRGDMSIVGPRPERPYFVEQFNEEIDGFKYRVYVKAGITGLAQILSNYSTDPKTKAKYDLMYIKNYSVLLDIIIIFNTVKTILLKDSSKGLAKEKELKELLNELNLKTYEEMGITKVDNI
jgi:exopolysaccharide biosynthesis polyprenyl glycosylphosphotransferase